MNKDVINYLKQHPTSIISFIIYVLLSLPLLLLIVDENFISYTFIVGEFPFAPIIAIPYIIIMILNAIFRKQHKLFYLVMVGLIYLPLLILDIRSMMGFG